MLNKPVFLVGFMGSGKTTWGKRLAHKLSLPFYDTDELIQVAEGKSITQIFHDSGEAYFRQKEREILLNLDPKPCIIATGGGLPCYLNNMESLNKLGCTVYLRLPGKALFSRLNLEKGKRPLLSNLDDAELLRFIQQKLEEREPVYLQSKVVVEVLKADVNSLVRHLLALNMQ
ncbi:MAG: shikimate kinase [Bacteroidia bacterium]|nr:shikimate kinase [Bacteroidia bacterium]